MIRNTNTCSKETADAPINSLSRLRQWPCKISFVPENAPYFDGAELLIAADCTAYAYGNFHSEFMKNSITLIGCPRLNFNNITEKLGAIISGNEIKSVKLLRMEVSCCSQLENGIKELISKSGKEIPFEVITLSTDGKILR